MWGQTPHKQSQPCNAELNQNSIQEYSNSIFSNEYFHIILSVCPLCLWNYFYTELNFLLLSEAKLILSCSIAPLHPFLDAVHYPKHQISRIPNTNTSTNTKYTIPNNKHAIPNTQNTHTSSQINSQDPKVV